MKLRNVVLVILLMGLSFGAGSLVVFYYHVNAIAGEHITTAKVLIRTQKAVANQDIETVDKNLSILIKGKIKALETADSIFTLSDSYKAELQEIYKLTTDKNSNR